VSCKKEKVKENLNGMPKILILSKKQQNWQEEKIQKTDQKATKSCICKAEPKAPQKPNEKQNVQK
jgi:hypothetical protein